jgi:hypothetical protein
LVLLRCLNYFEVGSALPLRGVLSSASPPD